LLNGQVEQLGLGSVHEGLRFGDGRRSGGGKKAGGKENENDGTHELIIGGKEDEEIRKSREAVPSLPRLPGISS